ncbi:MAG: hypothetical protein ABI592_09915 [Acidobacteriota bacterium]
MAVVLFRFEVEEERGMALNAQRSGGEEGGVHALGAALAHHPARGAAGRRVTDAIECPKHLSHKETIVISHSKRSVSGVGVAMLVIGLLMPGCRKTETAGSGEVAVTPSVASTTSAQAATGGAAPVGDTSRPPFGFLDTPKEGETVNAGSWAFGWALDDSGIAQVLVAAETGQTSPVALGQRFPGVAKDHPDYPNAALAGFGFPVPAVGPGTHTLIITLVGKDGGRTEIRRQIRVP